MQSSKGARALLRIGVPIGASLKRDAGMKSTSLGRQSSWDEQTHRKCEHPCKKLQKPSQTCGRLENPLQIPLDNSSNNNSNVRRRQGDKVSSSSCRRCTTPRRASSRRPWRWTCTLEMPLVPLFFFHDDWIIG